MNNDYYISIDLRDNNIFSPIRLSQFDKGSKVYFTITCDGEVFNCSNATASFQMSNNNDISKECSIVNNKVILEIDEDITSIRGQFPYQISILSNNTKITTVTNYIEIRKGGG